MLLEHYTLALQQFTITGRIVHKYSYHVQIRNYAQIGNVQIGNVHTTNVQIGLEMSRLATHVQI